MKKKKKPNDDKVEVFSETTHMTSPSTKSSFIKSEVGVAYSHSIICVVDNWG